MPRPADNNSALSHENAPVNVPSDVREGLSRRNIMTMMSAVAATPLISFVGTSPAIAKPTDRTTWDEAFAAYERAKSEDAAFNQVFDVLHERRTAEVDAIPVLPLPADEYVRRAAGETEGASDRSYWVKRARADVEEWDSGKVHTEECIREDYERHIAACRAVIAIDDEYRAAVKEIDRRLVYDDAEEKWEALGEAVYEAAWALMAVPAPDGPALLWKLDYLMEVRPDGSISNYSAESSGQTVADMRRLLAARNLQ